MVLKVKLIRGVLIFLVGGKRCCQFSWVAPFIISKLPCSKTRVTFSLVCLCLKAKFLSAPKLTEAIAPSFFNCFSSSLCQAIPSSPLWYRFRRQELNCSPVFCSIHCFNSISSLVQSKARLVMLE